MTTIAAKAVLVAGTGTGKSFDAFNMTGPQGTYRELSPVAAPGVIVLKRTDPKATKDYAGALKTAYSFTRQVADLQGRLWPQVMTVSFSQPAFLTDVQRTAFAVEGTLIQQDAIVQASMANGIVPQS